MLKKVCAAQQVISHCLHGENFYQDIERILGRVERQVQLISQNNLAVNNFLFC